MEGGREREKGIFFSHFIQHYPFREEEGAFTASFKTQRLCLGRGNQGWLEVGFE
jgi:hypothetical protein